VWIAGIPSALGLLFGMGVGAGVLVTRVRDWKRKRAANKGKPAANPPEPDEPAAQQGVEKASRAPRS
jgi:hypothetical protein